MLALRLPLLLRIVDIIYWEKYKSGNSGDIIIRICYAQVRPNTVLFTKMFVDVPAATTKSMDLYMIDMGEECANTCAKVNAYWVTIEQYIYYKRTAKQRVIMNCT